MSTSPKLRYTPEEYLALDRQAPFKSEYYAGKIVAMAGTSEKHNIIRLNLAAALAFQLRGGPCRPFVADMRVRIGAADLYVYPDVAVVCGERRFADQQRDVLLNPTVILEVLSPSTAAYEERKTRQVRFTSYEQLESLQEYLLVRQDRPLVVQYARQPDGGWLAWLNFWSPERDDFGKYARRPDGRWLLIEENCPRVVMQLFSLEAELALPEVYEGVSFEADKESR